MNKAESVIKLLIQTQKDVVAILGSSILEKPNVRTSVDLLSSATELYNQNVTLALEILESK